jgi:hypothetical protein
MYYPIGVFTSLAEAIQVVEGKAEPWTLSDQADYNDFCRLEVRERKLGLSERGKCVKQWEWTREYNDADDATAWKPVLSAQPEVAGQPKEEE